MCVRWSFLSSGCSMPFSLSLVYVSNFRSTVTYLSWDWCTLEFCLSLLLQYSRIRSCRLWLLLLLFSPKTPWTSSLSCVSIFNPSYPLVFAGYFLGNSLGPSFRFMSTSLAVSDLLVSPPTETFSDCVFRRSSLPYKSALSFHDAFPFSCGFFQWLKAHVFDSLFWAVWLAQFLGR